MGSPAKSEDRKTFNFSVLQRAVSAAMRLLPSAKSKSLVVYIITIIVLLRAALKNVRKLAFCGKKNWRNKCKQCFKNDISATSARLERLTDAYLAEALELGEYLERKNALMSEKRR